MCTFRPSIHMFVHVLSTNMFLALHLVFLQVVSHPGAVQAYVCLAYDVNHVHVLLLGQWSAWVSH